MIKCKICGAEFQKSVKQYKSFYYKDYKTNKVYKGAYRERRCPYCDAVISTKKLPYTEVQIDTEKMFKEIEESFEKTLKTFKEHLERIKKYFQ
ncbi:MAG: hypothetical protein QXK24_00075 [Ignisphaera sp.]